VKHRRYQLIFHTAVFKNTGRFGLLQVGGGGGGGVLGWPRGVLGDFFKPGG
jgi:hypothetical protein